MRIKRGKSLIYITVLWIVSCPDIGAFVCTRTHSHVVQYVFVCLRKTLFPVFPGLARRVPLWLINRLITENLTRSQLQKLEYKSSNNIRCQIHYSWHLYVCHFISLRTWEKSRWIKWKGRIFMTLTGTCIRIWFTLLFISFWSSAERILISECVVPHGEHGMNRLGSKFSNFWMRDWNWT